MSRLYESEYEFEAELEQAARAISAPGPTFYICAGTPIHISDFNYKQSGLRRDARRNHFDEIGRIAARIVASQRTRRPVTSVCINGHTDSSGPDEYNMRLGRARADVVLKELRWAINVRNLGPAGRRIKFMPQSFGEIEPVSPGSNSTPAGRARNRRVEVILSAPVRPAKLTCAAACQKTFMSCYRPLPGYGESCLKEQEGCLRGCPHNP